MAQKKHNGYLVKTFTFDGKRQYIYAKTQRELAEKTTQKLNELENGKREYYNPTLSALFDRYNDSRENSIKGGSLYTQSTIIKKILDIKLYNDKTLGEILIKDITRGDLEKVRKIMISEGLKESTINQEMIYLKSVFKYAVDMEIISRNPCIIKPLKNTKVPESENKHRALSQEETRRFFEKAKERNSIYINAYRLMINTGLRMGELGSLYLTDIDLKNGFIHVRRTLSRNESGVTIIGKNTKTDSGERDIPITREIEQIIKDQKEFNNIRFGLSWSGLLFKSDSGIMVSNECINRDIRRICKESGINYFSCHAFRATFATRFIEQRPQDYKILSEILGHSNISITLDLYTKVMTENKVNAMNEIQIKTV